MTTTFKPLYGTQGVALTITLASLGNTSARASTAVDNTSNLYLDALIAVKIKSGASGTAATGVVNVYAYGTVDGGTTYTEGATGTDAAITLTVPTNARLIGVLNVVANATTYIGTYSLAEAFGGIAPQKWGIIIDNESGAALDSTAGNLFVEYQGIQVQGV